MKYSFKVLHNQPMIRIKLTRDSVCAGDDIDAPHERIVEVYSFTDTHSFVNQFATGYLPSVNGYGHSWTAYLNGNPIALLTTMRIEPKVSEIQFEGENQLYFKYHSARY